MAETYQHYACTEGEKQVFSSKAWIVEMGYGTCYLLLRLVAKLDMLIHLWNRQNKTLKFAGLRWVNKKSTSRIWAGAIIFRK